MYQLQNWKRFSPDLVRGYGVTYKGHGERRCSISNLTIMADTETSKEPGHKEPFENYLVAWTCTIRGNNENLMTYYGNDPESFVNFLTILRAALAADVILIFFHNLSYDWVFVRRFLLEQFGEPVHQLNTKPHYPISVEFGNGLTFRDSLIIAQRSLNRWAEDLNVPDKKACGLWDYGKIRKQGGEFTTEELTYIEHDTLAGAECLDAYRMTLGKKISELPYTATGIVRERFRETARKNHGRQWFTRQALDYEYVALSEEVYHGGFTHMNRFLKGVRIDVIYTDGARVECEDLASSYPWALISEKYPAEKFTPINTTIDKILTIKDDYAFMFVATLIGVRLKDPRSPMPVLQASKAREIVNGITDNGRILQADAVVIPLTEIDLFLIDKYYTYSKEQSEVSNCIFAAKNYLPRWFTDFVFDLFKNKTALKGGDPVLYALAKAMLNSCYGMCVQHVMKDEIVEDYETGEYHEEYARSPKEYEKYLKRGTTFLPYQIGIWCTCYAMKNLFELGECVGPDGEWIYSDTDSVFGYNWDEEKLEEYNRKRRELLKARGYDGIEHNGRTYWLGVAELDKTCSEFKGLHSKCYCYRDAKSDELKITVAGVPKKGAFALKDDIYNFKPGFTFSGIKTGKLMHTYFFNEIHEDEAGNRIGDSIDLSPCAYVLDDPNKVDFEAILTEEIDIENVIGVELDGE